MYGAILGDMIGAPYEWSGGPKSKDFDLFKGAFFTDDTVLTVAIADAQLVWNKTGNLDDLRKTTIRVMREWGNNYPAGYGAGFRAWLSVPDPKPYNSCGNGAAMRISSVGWLYENLEMTRSVARAVTDVTHNHPEGIKGAEAVASAVYLARTGCTKERIKEYIADEFGYNLSRTVAEIRPTYSADVTCQGTVPEAIIAFLESTDFEDAIRTAVSLGGDCDTLTCITGGIAEAFYGVPEYLKQECLNRIPEPFRNILQVFWSKVRL